MVRVRSVWKYALPTPDPGISAYSMPAGAEFLHVGIDPADGRPTVWALVDPAAARETRTIVLRGTGHPTWEDERYIGTWVAPPFVWHAFERIEEAQ